jgi:ectoine hydroxylase
VTPDDILAREPLILTQSLREKYFLEGYLGAPALAADWLERLNSVTTEFIELSKTVTGRDGRFDLEPTHSARSPRLRRLNAPVEIHETYWEFASRGPFADIAEDLLGPDVKFHHSKLNFKWSDGGEEVKWHQDIQFWPHTNYDVLTIGVYLNDVDADMAPMGVLPGSHQGPLYDLYDEQGAWTGNLSDADVAALDLTSAAYLEGRAGTVTVHNCRSIHGSPPNLSERPRPLLLCAYSAADALPITDLTRGASHSETQIRGKRARWARFDPRPCLLPPDWGGGYKSIFAYQQGDA